MTIYKHTLHTLLDANVIAKFEADLNELVSDYMLINIDPVHTIAALEAKAKEISISISPPKQSDEELLDPKPSLKEHQNQTLRYTK